MLQTIELHLWAPVLQFDHKNKLNLDIKKLWSFII